MSRDHSNEDGHDHVHSHEEHGHSGDEHNHAHPEDAPDELKSRTRALQSLLLEKGLISTEAVDEVLRLFEEEVGPMNGARVVARAWSDPDFEGRLLDDANEALSEFDFAIGKQHLEVVENTPTVHNTVVCTLCSCYPWSILGLPPTWYKSPQYRSRIVREPRAVLSEFGLELNPEIEVRTWDSSSEVRYMVLPQRPPGTEGLNEEKLASLVTRNAMIGVERLGGNP
ncbi:nitrile hydratase subunit alpha [Natronorarus salvus]|uniref:nitrile hydratase subunit alpha n=1 Tax=Natronorarus salvus TaxID=3117733 RepID=UPI002F267562